MTNNVTGLTAEVLSAREIAEQEFAEEQQKRDVVRFKELYRSLDKAKKVVAAIEAEIADLEDELG